MKEVLLSTTKYELLGLLMEELIHAPIDMLFERAGKSMFKRVLKELEEEYWDADELWLEDKALEDTQEQLRDIFYEIGTDALELIRKVESMQEEELPSNVVDAIMREMKSIKQKLYDELESVIRTLTEE